ncbi:hypothetical protein EDD86DRAFT_74798 [Gorgonomyces haynaldii]|nr:hypothetical protein EDD86DRAFT_74798 [Gorgonomyces haynaldii]
MSTQDPVEIVNAFKDSNYFFLHGESIGTAFHAVIGIIGLLLMPLVVVAILKELKKTPSAPIILSLCMGDTFYLVNSVIFGIANTATGRWYFGFTGCVVNHVVVIAACFISVMSLIALTLERYLGVVHRTPLTVQHTLIMAAVIWFVAITVAFWPLYTLSTDYGIMLSVGKVICSFNWTTRGRAMLLTPIIMCVVTLVVGLVFIAFGYYQIVSLYFTVKKNLHKVIGNDTVAQAVMDKSTSSAPKKEYTEADKRLLYKAIALTVSFIICWSPCNTIDTRFLTHRDRTRLKRTREHLV